MKKNIYGLLAVFVVLAVGISAYFFINYSRELSNAPSPVDNNIFRYTSGDVNLSFEKPDEFVVSTEKFNSYTEYFESYSITSDYLETTQVEPFEVITISSLEFPINSSEENYDRYDEIRNRDNKLYNTAQIWILKEDWKPFFKAYQKTPVFENYKVKIIEVDTTLSSGDGAAHIYISHDRDAWQSADYFIKRKDNTYIVIRIVDNPKYGSAKLRQEFIDTLSNLSVN